MQNHHQRALNLLQKMTLEEKIAQLCAAWLEIGEDGSFTVKEIAFRNDKGAQDRETVLGLGIGQLTRPFGTYVADPKAIARGVNEIQRYLVGRTRLGIPAMLHEECLAGAMVNHATLFPCALNHGAAWDPDLSLRVAKAIGDLMRSIGVHEGLAPVLDVARDARWGRLEETFGEDPYLTGCLGIAYVDGFQGKTRHPIATLKHFVGHSASEGGRNHAPVHIGRRELLNMFALPFEMVVKRSRPGALMPAYHDIDGVPCSADRDLLQGLLRRDWGFDGLIVADYEAVSQLHRDQKIAKDLAEASAMALKAGMDLELPSSTAFREGLLEAVRRNLVEVTLIDASVKRILIEKFRLGVFDHPFIDIEGIDLGSDSHHRLAVEAAEKSIVMLKNDGTLPLDPQGTIAIIGPLADHPYAMFSGYSYPVHLQGAGTPQQTIPSRVKTIKKAIESTCPDATILFEPGCMLFESPFEEAIFFPGDVSVKSKKKEQVLSTNTSRIGDAVAAAEKSDAVVLVVGDVVGLFQQGTAGEGSDVSSLRLPGIQQQLVDAVLDTGKPVVIVLVSARPYDLGRADAESSAILAAWLPGEGGGEAIANILVGKTNPSGKSPLSFPLRAGAMPYAYNHLAKSAGLPRQHEFGFRYPFGHGLSYTDFTYESCEVDRTRMGTDGTCMVRVRVRNSGTVAGDEIVQLYVHDRFASVVRPVKELKGFARVSLEPMQCKTVSFRIKADMLSFIGLDYSRIVEPGLYDLMIGSSSEHVVWQQELELTGETRVLGQDWQLTTETLVEQ